MSLYLGSEKVENVTAQITLPVEPSDDLPLANGTASAGTSKKFSRADHVHPMETVEATLVDLPSAEELGAIPAPTSGTTGQVLTKTASGQKWADVPVDENSVLLKNIDIALPTNSSWHSVCYGNDKFVAIAYNSNIAAYSTDGIHWTQTILPTSTKWNSVCYGDGKFVAVTDNTSIAAYSTNGINWTQTTMPGSRRWLSVCYGGGKFVAVCFNSTLPAYSTDGITWSSGSLPASKSWISVCYGNGKFVAVANNTNIAAYSTDGINWTQTTMPTNDFWNSACYGNGKFVAITDSISSGSNIAAYSADGINWTQSTLPIKAGWSLGCYGNGKFVAISKYSINAAYSTDGINWTQATPPIDQDWRSICYGNDKFVAVAYDSSITAYSTDGINWNSTTKGLQYPDGTDIHEQVRNTLQIPEPESEVFTVTLSGYDGHFTSNKTGVEIQKAYDAGKICVARVRSSDPMFAIQVFESEATFVSSLNYDGTTEIYRITYDGTVQYTKNNINPTARKVTLTTSGWSNNQQIATCTGVSSSATSQEIRVMPADASKTSAYVSCGVSCVAQASNKLTFACDTVPTTAIDVYVVMQSLNFQS